MSNLGKTEWVIPDGFMSDTESGKNEVADA